MTPPIEPGLLRTFRTYQRHGSYEDAAAELGLSRPQIKRRLLALYASLGIEGGAGIKSGMIASYILRDLPY